MAVTDKTTAAEVKKAGNTQLAVPYLFQHMFPSWFTGIAFAAIIIGALVPAAIMAIAAANLFTRNIFKEFFKPDASPRLETRVSRWASLVVKFGALYFAVWLPHTFAINLQLLGGVWILQIAPDAGRWPVHAVVPPLGAAYRLAGGMTYGTIAAYNVSSPDHVALGVVVGHRVRASRVYIGITAVVVNLVLLGRADRDPEGRQGPRRAPTRRCRTSTPPTPRMPRRPSPRA